MSWWKLMEMKWTEGSKWAPDPLKGGERPRIRQSVATRGSRGRGWPSEAIPGQIGERFSLWHWRRIEDGVLYDPDRPRQAGLVSSSCRSVPLWATI